MRLQKILASAGLASRREAEAWIRAGRVRVNGAVAALGESADPDQDDIRVDERPLHAEPKSYWLLHKPRGVLTTTRDPHARLAGRRTVLDLLPPAARRRRLFPVGRLDLDSEGLLLLTNDGDVAQALLHPSHGCERQYRVTVRGRVSRGTTRALEGGVLLEGRATAPCRADVRRFDPQRELTTLELTLREGRKRQIRRALALLGHPVVRLVRTRMGPLRLGRLPPGGARPLRRDERRALERFEAGRERGGAAGSAARGRKRGGNRPPAGSSPRPRST